MKTITLPLSEYEDLIGEIKELREKISEVPVVGIHKLVKFVNSGYVTLDTYVYFDQKTLPQAINEIKEENSKQYLEYKNDLNKLSQKLKEKEKEIENLKKRKFCKFF